MPDTARSPWNGALVCFALALAARLVVAWQVEIPGRDGATYLWMGERIAQGDLGASFATVFPPVYPWCIALVLRMTPITDVVFAAQLASLLPAALAVFPLWAISLRLGGPVHAWAAGLCYALGAWFARHPADCMSEGPFYLWVALVVLLLLRRARAAELLLAGALAGLAFGTRPEGAGLLLVGAPWLWQKDRAAAARFAAAAALACAPFVLGYSLRHGSLQITPKAAFNWEVGVGNADQGGPLYYLEHLLRVPGHLFEATGYVATALALAGLWSRRRGLLRSDAALPFLLLCLQVAVIPLVRATIRFVSGYGILLLPFAGDGLALLARRWQPRAAACVALALVALAPDLVRIVTPQRTEKAVLKELGLYLRARLGPDELFASAERRPSSAFPLPSSMCRVEFFAGQQPGPPRPMQVAEILQLAADPRCRMALLAGEGPGIEPEDLAALGYRPHALPPGLAERAAERRIAAFERP